MKFQFNSFGKCLYFPRHCIRGLTVPVPPPPPLQGSLFEQWVQLVQPESRHKTGLHPLEQRVVLAANLAPREYSVPL